MTAKYIAETNSLQEKSQKEPPNRLLYSEREIIQYHNDVVEYSRHLATLRTIPCSPECRGLWKEGDKLEEGKNYEVRPVCIHTGNFEYADCVHPSCDKCAMTAFPLPVNGEDDMRELFHKMWGDCKDKIYNKADWMKLQNLIDRSITRK